MSEVRPSGFIHGLVALISLVGIIILLYKISALEHQIFSTKEEYKNDRKALISYYNIKIDSMQIAIDSLRFQIKQDHLVMKNFRTTIIYRDTCLGNTFIKKVYAPINLNDLSGLTTPKNKIISNLR